MPDQYKPRTGFAVFLSCFFLSTLFAQDDMEFEIDSNATLTPLFLSFSHVEQNLSVDSFSFYQEKIAFGARFTINKYWSGVVVVDFLKDPSEHPYLKPAFVTYQTSSLKLDMGIIFLSHWRHQLRSWNNRYILKSFLDYYDFGWSADLGIRGRYKFNKYFEADVSVVNGEGYKEPGLSPPFKYSTAAYFTPRDPWLFKVYYDFEHNEQKEKTTAVFINYIPKSRYTFSAEYNYKQGLALNQLSAHGFSGYSNIYFTNYLGVFFRYDQIWYNFDETIVAANTYLDNQLVLYGLQYQLFENIRIAAAFKRRNFVRNKPDNIIQLSLEYRTP